VRATRLPNGRLIIPKTEEGPTTYGGYAEIGPGDVAYEEWLAVSDPGSDPRRNPADYSLALYQSGHQFGSRWARGVLTSESQDDWSPLIRLVGLGTKHPGPAWEAYFEAGHWAQTPLERLHMAIDPQMHGSPDAFEEFMGSVFGDNRRKDFHRPSFVRGFAEGVIDVWDEMPH
jgi:hypothetical protein